MAIVTSGKDFVRATLEPDSASWRHAMKTAIRDPIELCRTLELPVMFEEGAVHASSAFPVFAPRAFVDKMESGNPHDPLLRQVLPLTEELVDAPGFVSDPVDDNSATLTPGLLRKYQGRALMITTGACAVHCRYCFRREFPYDLAPKSIDDWRPALDQIESDATLEEIILSGGDPLTLVDEQLTQLSEALARIRHVKRLRIHTRLPIMIPGRVTNDLVALLRESRFVPIVVIHANHAAELDESVASSLARLTDSGIPLLNQAVLLRGVNDNIDALANLSRRLIHLRVMPYYLHQLDRVAGAAHFEVSQKRGRELVAQLRKLLPGYGVPRYVQETPANLSKTVLA